MQTLKVSTLIEALALVGQVCRNKDDSETADAVTKILEQFDDAEEMSLAEWAEARRLEANAAPELGGASEHEEQNLKVVLEQLESIKTQVMLHDAITHLALSTSEWKCLARMLTGYLATSEQDAREMVETHLSDRLLLEERIESVKRQFNSTTPPPWGVS